VRTLKVTTEKVTVTIVVSIGEAVASNDREAVLATYALGSCVGVALYDAAAGVGGLLHCQLPSSTLDERRAAERPELFADTGFDCLLRRMESLGAHRSCLRVAVAGGARMISEVSAFNIGPRNHAAIGEALGRHGLHADVEEVGGSTPRNLYLSLADGAFTIKPVTAPALSTACGGGR
jgi:chemotaxis protein CheD